MKALGSNNPIDKSNWIENKIDNENYNDVYFADDSLKNIEAVRNMLSKKNIKYTVQRVEYD